MGAGSLAVAGILHLYWYDLRPTTLVTAQIAAIACALAVLWLAPGMRIHLVPRRLRYRRAHDNAVRPVRGPTRHKTPPRAGGLGDQTPYEPMNRTTSRSYHPARCLMAWG